eukprot:6173620-Pleurochrysis_carterae.AAC.1
MKSQKSEQAELPCKGATEHSVRTGTGEEHDGTGGACARGSAHVRRTGRLLKRLRYYLILTNVSYQLPTNLTFDRHILRHAVNCRFSARAISTEISMSSLGALLSLLMLSFQGTGSFRGFALSVYSGL